MPSGLHALHSTGLSWFMEALGMACPLACTSQQQTWLFQNVPAIRLDVGLKVMLDTPSLGCKTHEGPFRQQSRLGAENGPSRDRNAQCSACNKRQQ